MPKDETSQLRTSLGQAIRLYRILQGYSHEQFGQLAGLSGRSIARLEKGEKVSLGSLLAACEIAAVDPGPLLQAEGFSAEAIELYRSTRRPLVTFPHYDQQILFLPETLDEFERGVRLFLEVASRQANQIRLAMREPELNRRLLDFPDLVGVDFVPGELPPEAHYEDPEISSWWVVDPGERLVPFQPGSVTMLTVYPQWRTSESVRLAALATCQWVLLEPEVVENLWWVPSVDAWLQRLI